MKTYSTKLIKVLFYLFIAGTFIFGCKKEQTENTTTSDEYYVKYSIAGNGAYILFNKFTVATDRGTSSFSGYQYRTWTQTYGPVSKGFKASVSVESQYVKVEIYVSKNNGPFALKASKSGTSNSTAYISQSYTIDF